MQAGSKPRLKPGVVLRDAQESDDDALIGLWHELMAHHLSFDARFALSDDADRRFRDYLATARTRDDYRARVATVQGRALGFSVACVLPNSPIYLSRWIGYINDLVVTGSARRQGIGELLVRDAVQWLVDCGAESVEIYVAHQNSSGRQFWQRMGAQPYLERLTLDLARFEDPQ